jgi:hypothetical protein
MQGSEGENKAAVFSFLSITFSSAKEGTEKTTCANMVIASTVTRKKTNLILFLREDSCFSQMMNIIWGVNQI